MKSAVALLVMAVVFAIFVVFVRSPDVKIARPLLEPAAPKVILFKYQYHGGKTHHWGEISPDAYHIHQASSYPSGYDIKGKTLDSTWALVLWLYQYGNRDRNENGGFGIEVEFDNGQKKPISLNVDKCHLVLFQILDECKVKSF
jgi:hypothetical protein